MSPDSDKLWSPSSKWSWVVFVSGLTVWLAVQGYLILMPVFSRSAPPEPKDTLPYIARTERMEKCFWGDCPALKDLTAQFSAPSTQGEADAYRSWASTIFGSNQVGLSLTLLGLKRFGLDVIAGYRAVCVIAVLLFGIGFGYLLTVLWGRTAAGMALLLLAFKTFPDTGLNFVVPSNLCMGLATLVWARVISREGRALWTLGIGSVVLIAFHPLGAVYSLIAAILALALSGTTFSRRAWATAAVAAGILAVALLMPTRIYNLSEYVSIVTPVQILTQGARSVAKALVEAVKLDQGLYGSLPFFLACIALGVIVASPEQRARLVTFLKVYSVFLVVSLFYPPREPGDTFLRLWIPVVVALFGAIGAAWQTALRLAWNWMKGFSSDSRKAVFQGVKESWPLVAAALITGFVVQLSFAGAEQVVAMSEHFKNLWPLNVSSRQTDELLAKARPGDKVLYESMMLMNYFFAKGALDLGAVYYHPVLRGTLADTEWLRRPDLRFVVAFNPLAVHPGFEHLHERKWGTSCPDFRFSPLMAPKKQGPILSENGIEVRRYAYIDVEWTRDPPPHTMTVFVNNSGCSCAMLVSPINESGQPSEERTISFNVPARSDQRYCAEFEGTPDLGPRTGRKGQDTKSFKIDLRSIPALRFRLRFPTWNSQATIVGLHFDDSQLNWPWDSKGRLIIPDPAREAGTMVFSFDPEKIIPTTLRERSVTVVNDSGSSVLLELQPLRNEPPK
jgi:hypothetical protein